MSVHELRPVIAVTVRRTAAGRLAGSDGRFADRPLDVGYADYSRRLADAGAAAVLLPFEADPVSVLARVDALVLSGGQDLATGAPGDLAPADPERWCGPGEPDARRDGYEAAVLRRALEIELPVLAVCRGAQLLNVARGGSLQPDLGALTARHNPPREVDGLPVHDVAFTPGSLAWGLYGRSREVNSYHHQALAALGRGVVVTGRSADGVIETVEVPGHPVLGVQWHPELDADLDPCLRWIVNQATTFALRRAA
jgi:putative glutamine amidotransferase